ncbi:MAG: hypothetical protein N3A69_18435, partial [Leptospiraceae bacterium]|nr:hypothetical protein [Leptospiraceae bacterium]
MKSRLNEKKNKPFDVLANISIENPENEAKKGLSQLNEIIQQNNDKINGLSKEKEQIKNELIAHYSASAIDEINYGEQKQKIADL